MDPGRSGLRHLVTLSGSRISVWSWEREERERMPGCGETVCPVCRDGGAFDRNDVRVRH